MVPVVELLPDVELLFWIGLFGIQIVAFFESTENIGRQAVPTAKDAQVWEMHVLILLVASVLYRHVYFLYSQAIWSRCASSHLVISLQVDVTVPSLFFNSFQTHIPSVPLEWQATFVL